MNECPVCGNNLVHRVTMLHHVWYQHMKEAPGHWSPMRQCWCGLPTAYLAVWLGHMEGVDLQAHYAASALGLANPFGDVPYTSRSIGP